MFSWKYEVAWIARWVRIKPSSFFTLKRLPRAIVKQYIIYRQHFSIRVSAKKLSTIFRGSSSLEYINVSWIRTHNLLVMSRPLDDHHGPSYNYPLELNLVFDELVSLDAEHFCCTKDFFSAITLQWTNKTFNTFIQSGGFFLFGELTIYRM